SSTLPTMVRRVRDSLYTGIKTESFRTGTGYRMHEIGTEPPQRNSHRQIGVHSAIRANAATCARRHTDSGSATEAAIARRIPAKPVMATNPYVVTQKSNRATCRAALALPLSGASHVIASAASMKIPQ